MVNARHIWKVPDLCRAKASAKASIEKLMHMCKINIPNMKQNGWKFPKFHELLHIVDGMERFGSPRNFNAERPESLLISAAKKTGRRAQSVIMVLCMSCNLLNALLTHA